MRIAVIGCAGIGLATAMMAVQESEVSHNKVLADEIERGILINKTYAFPKNTEFEYLLAEIPFEEETIQNFIIRDDVTNHCDCNIININPSGYG